MKHVLIVGAGFAGATYARIIAEAGHCVDVIDSRDHVAGNCYDYIDSNGVRIHKYGPHLFHTSNLRVVEWLSQYTEWVNYSHSVVAKLPDSRLVPLPVNRVTINKVYEKNLRSDEEVEDFLRGMSEPRTSLVSAEDWLYSRIGAKLTNLFFRPYTKKMWDLDLSEISASVVQRIQIRTDEDSRYFPGDTFQAMPKNGYTALFDRILDHENISINLETMFDRKHTKGYDFCFNSMPIDLYFDFVHGELPYRSIKFHLFEEQKESSPEHTTINYTDTSPYTRETWWHNIPGHMTRASDKVPKTIEEPCDYKQNNFERYYPIKTQDGKNEERYRLYEAEASKIRKVQFIGRCGTYQYLDMHQVINQSIAGATKWLAGI